MKQEDALAIAEKIISDSVQSIPYSPVPKVEMPIAEGDEEVMVIMVSDLQTGLKFPGFTSVVLRNRIKRLGERVIKLATIHRHSYPIRKLVVFALGDFIQNDRVGAVVSLDELEKVVMDQVFQVAVPCFSEFLLTVAQGFDKVEVHTVDGNHGSLGKYAAIKTNWDNIVYRTTALRLQQYPEIAFNIESNFFYKKVKIWNKVFLLVHGDQIPMHLTLPWYGITTRAMRWQGSLPGLPYHYLVMGHFHVASFLDWNDVEVFVNGCFVSSNQWVLKKLGLSSSTSQIAFGVHPRKGVTWRYKIRLD